MLLRDALPPGVTEDQTDRRRREVDDLGQGQQGLTAADVLAADEVDRASVDDRQDPRARARALGEEAVGGPPDGEKRLLHRVLRERLVAQDPQREAVGDSAETIVELCQRVLVRGRDEREERLVREVHQLAAPAGSGRVVEDKPDHVLTFSLCATGFEVGCGAPPLRSSVTATTEPEDTRRGISTIEVPARPWKRPAGFALPAWITHAS